jgi:hypothetical protein
VAIFASEHGDAFHFRWLRQDGEMRLNCLGAKLQGSSAPAAAFLRGALGPRRSTSSNWLPISACGTVAR